MPDNFEYGFNTPSLKYFTTAAGEAVERYGLTLAHKISHVKPIYLKPFSDNKRFGFGVSEYLLTDRIGRYHVMTIPLSGERVSITQAISNNRHSDYHISHGVFPLGPVNGQFQVGSPDHTQFIFYTFDGSRNLGPVNPIDRFPGLDISVNDKFSGGLIITHEGNLHIGNRTELTNAAKQNQAAAQLFYSWNSHNSEELMNLMWHHHGIRQQIGNSVHEWSWFLETGDKLYYLSPLTDWKIPHHFPIRYINFINEKLADGQEWKAALADSGFGGGFTLSDGQSSFSNRENQNIFHTVPAYLLAVHQN